MAVKQQPTDTPQQSGGGQQQQQQQQKVIGKIDIEELLYKINEAELNPDKVPVGHGLVKYCEDIVFALGKVDVPFGATKLKSFISDIEQVNNFLRKICQGGEYGTDIYTQCLKAVYSSITSKEKPSEAMSIVLGLYNETWVQRAIKFILNSSDRGDDDAVKRGVIVLCYWLRCFHFVQNINLWVIGIMNELREARQYHLLLDIGAHVADGLFISLLIPNARQQVAPVIFCILSSIRHTPLVFHKILKRVPGVVHQLRLENNNPATQDILQKICDIVLALIELYPGYDDVYKPVLASLSENQTSLNFRATLDVPPWNDTSQIVYRKTNVRVGLVNLGNTCYMNSVIQALVMTKQFSRELLMMPNKTTLFTKMQQLLALLLYSQRPELTPRIFLQCARPPGFHLGHQQDSSEFLGHLLETLHEQEKSLTVNDIRHDQYMDTGSKNNSNIIESLTDSTMDTHTLDGAYAIHQSQSAPVTQPNHSAPITMIQRTFGGNLSVVYKCLTCNTESKHTDIFRDLQLSFPVSTTEVATNHSVQDLLDFYCTSEKLDGDNQYFCEKCNTLCDGERYINILRAPRNLILTLKHFKYDQQFQQRAKLMHKVFHDETISLKVMSDEPSSHQELQVNYELYAAVVHSGISMDSGHYYTYASDQPDYWYMFNDNYVSASSISELHNLSPPNTPYILFYQMVSTSVTGVEGAAAVTVAETHESNGVTELEKVKVPALNDLPPMLREYIQRDLMAFRDEQRIENQKTKAFPLRDRNGGYRDNDDDPPPSNCGGNALNYVNDYVF